MRAFADYETTREYTDFQKLPAGAYEITIIRAEDNGDDLIIVSQSRGGVNGYWRTDGPEEIRYFFNETKKRAINTFKPLKKMRRVLKNVSQL